MQIAAGFDPQVDADLPVAQRHRVAGVFAGRRPNNVAVVQCRGGGLGDGC